MSEGKGQRRPQTSRGGAITLSGREYVGWEELEAALKAKVEAAGRAPVRWALTERGAGYVQALRELGRS